MNIKEFNNKILQPSLSEITPIIDVPRSSGADILLLAIAGQESNWTHRYQVTSAKNRKGPARGFWQFEKNGGVAGVMRHNWTSSKAKKLVSYLELDWNRTTLWTELETNDLLSTGFARLLLWTDPNSLPRTSPQSWRYYIRNWRPGKPHPAKWRNIWNQSKATISEL